MDTPETQKVFTDAFKEEISKSGEAVAKRMSLLDGTLDIDKELTKIPEGKCCMFAEYIYLLLQSIKTPTQRGAITHDSVFVLLMQREGRCAANIINNRRKIKQDRENGYVLTKFIDNSGETPVEKEQKMPFNNTYIQKLGIQSYQLVTLLTDIRMSILLLFFRHAIKDEDAMNRVFDTYVFDEGRDDIYFYAEQSDTYKSYIKLSITKFIECAVKDSNEADTLAAIFDKTTIIKFYPKCDPEYHCIDFDLIQE
jgi:hypothetical protein